MTQANAGLTTRAVWAAVLGPMDQPFVWGVADCCTAACDAFRDLHGVDPMGPLRGTYRSRSGAARAIRDRGGFDVMAHDMAAAAGLVPGQGAPGEIALVHGATGPALAIGIGGGLFVQKSAMGHAMVRGAVASWGVA